MTVSIDFDDLTKEEKAAVKQIDKAMKTLGKRHWMYMSASALHIMRYGNENDKVMLGCESPDPDYSAASIYGHDTDGGDW